MDSIYTLILSKVRHFHKSQNYISKTGFIAVSNIDYRKIQNLSSKAFTLTKL